VTLASSQTLDSAEEQTMSIKLQVLLEAAIQGVEAVAAFVESSEGQAIIQEIEQALSHLKAAVKLSEQPQA
jgi:biotin-(acetyl-CoA carboxylase) ligase